MPSNIFPYYSNASHEDMQDIAALMPYRAQDTNFNRRLTIPFDTDGFPVYTVLVSFLFPKDIYLSVESEERHASKKIKQVETCERNNLIKLFFLSIIILEQQSIAQLEATRRKEYGNSCLGNLARISDSYFVQKEKLKKIVSFKDRLEKLRNQIEITYEKYLPTIHEKALHLLEFNKEKKILKGAVQLELLVEETYYIHVVLLLCEAIKEKKHIPFVVCTLQDYITELQPVWQKMLPSDGYYYLSKNRREKIPVAYFTDFLDGLAPKNKMQKLNFDPLVGGAHYLVAQLMNIYLFTLAHAVRVKLNWRAALPVIDLEVKRLQEALVFPLVEKLVSEAFSVTSLVKPKVLLGLAHAIDVSLAGLAAEFKKLGQDTNDIDELLKCLRFSYAFLDVSLQNANTPAVKK